VKRLAFPLLGIIFSTLIFLPIVRAEDVPQQGVTMTVYDGVMVNLDPWQQEPEQPVCYSGVVSMIDFDWGGAPAADGCPHDFFMVHFTGWLTVPESGQWEFLNWSDDGWYMTLDGVVTLDDWNFHGCGGHWSGPNEGYSQLVAGQSYALDIWMFEWGGGACARLDYGSPSGYGVVPAAWLTTSALPAPTPTPSPEPSLEPSVEPSADPTPSVEPSPTPTLEPSPSVEPTPSEVPNVQPSPIPSPTSTPKPSPTADPTPEPSASQSASPDPSPVPSDSPSVAPSVEPEPSSEPSPDNIGEQTVAAVGEAVAAVAETVSKAIEAITNLGKDLSPAEKKKAAPVAVAIVISQVASAAVAAASSAAAAARKVDK
jgi:hypothetical protein